MTPAPFVARGSPGRLVVLMLLSVLLVAASLFVLFGIGDDIVLRVIGGIGTLLFTAGFIVALRQLSEGKVPLIEVRTQGLYWRRWSDRTIPWSAFTHAEVKAMQNQTFLCLWLRDPEAYRSTAVLGRVARLNKAMGFGDIALSTQASDRRFADLVAAVEAHAPQLFDAA